MKPPARRLFATLPVLATLAAPVSARGQMPSHSFEVGSPFPTLSLPSLDDGRPASVADFRGRKLILHVFASW
jgi:hypothetical protein